MKAVIIVAIVIAVMVVALTAKDSVEYIRETEEVIVEVEVKVDSTEKRIADAQAEAMAEIETKANTIRDQFIQKELDKVESEVLKEIQAELKARQVETDKRTGAFWSDPQNIKAHIKAMFPEDPHTALAIVACESGFKPNAYNPTNTNGTTDGGLWQINTVHDGTLKQLGLDKWDPEDATKYARMLYERNGWRDWVCYTHGKIAMR